MNSYDDAYTKWNDEHNNCHATMMINETMNRKGKIMRTYHHHAMLTINFANTKWNHEQGGGGWWAPTIVWPLHHNNDQLCSMNTKNENMRGVNKVK